MPTLEALCAAGHRPRLVVTQPARPAGRGREVQPPPVARAASGHGLVVCQPQRLADERFRQRLAELAPDLGLVVAYGRIFPDWLLALPRLGCVNLHASLLPRWRGAAPIQAALAAGDEETGVTTMLMEAGLDAGPVMLQRRLVIGALETAGELTPRLARDGAELVLETVGRLEAGTVEPQLQDAERATHAPRLRRQDGRVDWCRPARELFNRWRAFTPWPGLTAELGGQPVKLVRVEPAQHADSYVKPPTQMPAASGAAGLPGEILTVDASGIDVACGDANVLRLSVLQRAGRRALAAADFARGERLGAGDRFA